MYDPETRREEQDAALAVMLPAIVQYILAHIHGSHRSDSLTKQEAVDPDFYALEVEEEERKQSDFDGNENFLAYLEKLNSGEAINGTTYLIMLVTIEWMQQRLSEFGHRVTFRMCTQKRQNDTSIKSTGTKVIGQEYSDSNEEITFYYMNELADMGGHPIAFYYSEANEPEKNVRHNGKCFFYGLFNGLLDQLNLPYEESLAILQWDREVLEPKNVIENYLAVNQNETNGTAQNLGASTQIFKMLIMGALFISIISLCMAVVSSGVGLMVGFAIVPMAFGVALGGLLGLSIAKLVSESLDAKLTSVITSASHFFKEKLGFDGVDDGLAPPRPM